MIRIAQLLFAVLTFVVSAAAFTQSDAPYVPDRIIVKFKNPIGPSAVSSLPAGASALVERRLGTGAQVLRISGLTVEEALMHFAADPRVEYVEPDYIITLDQTGQNLPNDPRFDELYGMDNTGQTGGTPDADIDAPEAWTIQTGGDVLIGVIDTGIDWQHEDLAANIWTNPGEIPNNGVDDDNNGFIDDVRGWDFVNGDNNPMDDNRHGTHVSGTIAAVGDNGVGITGVCWRANLLAIKVLDGDGRGSISTAIAGIEYSILMGARLTNNSWGVDVYSRALDEALAVLAETNALFVAAAGNGGRSSDFFPHYPASHEYDNIVSVAATDHDDALSNSSNFGVESVDLSAPGSLIRSLVLDSKYGILSGTSMATPHVSGAIGLILAEAPLMTPQQVKALLMATVDPVPSMDGKVGSHGRLNVYNALDALDEARPGRIADLKVAQTGSNTITLTWTATGDDADKGTAAVNDIRYANHHINKTTFEQATRIDNLPRPNASGTQASFRVNGLDVNTTYFFAMRVMDERLNVSELSNVVAGKTQGTPEVSFKPGAFEGVALSGASVTRTMRITNSGKGSIDFAFAPGAYGWVTADPSSGTVYAGEIAEIAVTLQALGLSGGEHNDVVNMTTNDPAMPYVQLPARLMVKSAPHVAVSDAIVDFGAWFIGAETRREIRVTNRGDQLLVVTAVEVTEVDAGFSVDIEPFTLPPSMGKTIAIDFAPPMPREVIANLRVISNDPDEPEITLALAGRGLVPPDIRVIPIQLAAQLNTGATSSHSATIVNEGTGDLEWELSVADDVDPSDSGGGAGAEGPFRDLSDVRILYDAVHTNLHWFNYNTVFTDLKFRGAEIVASSARFTREYLDSFDVVWISEARDPIAREERDVLVEWVLAGGGLLLEGDSDPTVANFNGILQALFSGIEMSTENGNTGITNNIEAHETTRDVSDVFLIHVKATLSAVRPPARLLIYDIEGVGNTAWSRAGAGRLLVMADQNLANHRMGRTGNQILGNRAIDWLALGVSWLDALPSSGVLAPGESQILDVRIDAMGLGGPFESRLVVRSNDPDEPAVVVPVHLDATRAPDIVVSAPVLQFPRTAVERASQHEVWVGNVGTLDLEVTGVSSSTADFTVAPSVFTVPRGGIVTLTITYAPASAGEHTAVVTLTSDDPDEELTTIAVGGQSFTGVPGTVRIVNRAGLNLRSWNLDTADDAPETVFADLLPHLDLAVGYEDGGGLIFDPQSPDPFRTLKRLDHLRSYWIEMSAADSMTIEGFVVDPQTPIPLREGLNTISYLPVATDTPEHAMQSVLDNLEWLVGYEDGGLMYVPTIPAQLNTLRELKPTYGYWVNMSAPDTLVYPDTVATIASGKNIRGPYIAPASRTTRATREWIGLWGRDVVIDGQAVSPGTMVTVSDRSGVVCGECVVGAPGEFGLMAVYRDDPATAVDEGADAGEQLTLRLGDRTFAGVRWTETGDIFEFNAVAIVTSELPTGPPQQTALHQNFPNPFNPSTTIRYNLHETVAVMLVVYNVRGQMVRTLVDEVGSPGTHTIAWHGTDEAGATVATGVYFYRLVAGEFTQTRKMVLLK